MNIQNISETATPSSKGYWVTSIDEHISYTENGHNLIEESEESSFWYEHRLNCLQVLLHHYPLQAILDVGGGNGQIVEFLQNQSINAVLLEPMIEGVLNAQKKGVQQIVWGSLESLAPKENSIPAIGLFDVLEHIEDDQQLLAQLYKALAPQGWLLISVPAFQFLFSDFDREVGHYRRYTLRKLSQKLAQCGFEIQYKTYLFLPLPLLIWPIRKFYRLIKKRTKRRKLGHVQKNGFFGSLLRLYLKTEIFLIKRKISIPFGSTCVIVACKT
ncbi:hypothetical protein BKI52_45265 [marine bacterium AO1-C]|nr:hypothetical protein BKI52_45265 [marine bacterium AO1-C]